MGGHQKLSAHLIQLNAYNSGARLILFEDEPWEDAMVEIIEILR